MNLINNDSKNGSVFESSLLESISEDNLLDTTSLVAITKYRSNLKILIEKAKKNGKIDDFRIIRNDDFFPRDWQWRVASKNTNIEGVSTELSRAIKFILAHNKLGGERIGNSFFPYPESDLKSEIEKISKSIGLVYMPVKFRSTKHFTINTPLSYTGEYNQVNSGRRFTIIDTMDNFLTSGYGYSIDYNDAYLDVTHESLKISDIAIILIQEDAYKEIIQDEEIALELHERRVVLYRGDEAIAINMILTELGVLPYRPGGEYAQYDDEIREILVNSMKGLSSQYDLLYSQDHGSIFGQGGHFSDLYDGYNLDYNNYEEEFIEFLKRRFSKYSNLINIRILKDFDSAVDFIDTVGIDQVLSSIDEYNNLVYLDFERRFQKYKNDRSTITPDISYIFKRTLSIIKYYHLHEEKIDLSLELKGRIRNLICLFFQSDTVESQLQVAEEFDKIFAVLFEGHELQSSQNIRNK